MPQSDCPAAGDYSPVEEATLRHLGCRSFDFTPLTPRCGNVPPPLQHSVDEERRVWKQLQTLNLDWVSRRVPAPTGDICDVMSVLGDHGPRSS